MKNKILKVIYRVLAFYAKKVIGRHKPTVIAITGSVGKTTTKEAIYKVLKDEYGGEVRANYGNLNAEIGIPLTILGYDKMPSKLSWPFFLIAAGFRVNVKTYPKILILEMGVEHKGDIDYFCSMAKPDYAIITSLSPAHIENFKTIESYQKEKLSLLENLKPEGKAFINIDDKDLDKVNGDNIVTIGIDNSRADYLADNIEFTIEGTEFRINRTGRKIAISSKLLGKALVASQLFAFALADEMGINLMKAAKSIENIRPVAGRLRVVSGQNHVTIIDDSYNANPKSTMAALDVLEGIKQAGRKVAILGNMNELGNYSKEGHIEVGKYAKDKCDLAIFIGENAKYLAEGYNDSRTSMVFSNRREFESQLERIINPDDLVLAKASQNGGFFEEIVKRLMKDPSEAEKILVRQGAFWRKKKK